MTALREEQVEEVNGPGQDFTQQVNVGLLIR